MYSSIRLKSEISKTYLTEDELEIKNLSRVNIFIGPNNSGKSRFLRILFQDDRPLFKTEVLNIDKIQNAFSAFKSGVKNSHPEIQLRDCGVNEELFYLPNERFITAQTNLSNIIKELERLQNAKLTTQSGLMSIGGTSTYEISRTVNKYANHCLIDLKDSGVEKFDNEIYKKQNVYIPTLRGLRGISYSNLESGPNNSDGYKFRTIQDYFNGIKDIGEKIYTGLGLYDDVKRLLLSVSSDREKIKNFENFLSNTFFEGKEVSIIPHIDSNVVYVKIGDDDDRPIYDLGEGIQSIIILTYPLFLNQGENMNFFFEEPDLYLHPGYQRIFLETLNDKRFRSFQYFFTTHSNHFLDMTLDFSETSVYSFQRRSKDQFAITNIKNANKDILQALGARNSSVFLTNCTIWVEGITDRIYFRKYLEILMKEKQRMDHRIFKEDIHYSFVEYGGNNITHWSFLEDEDDNHPNIDIESLCGKLFLISDSDNATKTSKKFLRQIKLKEKLGDNFYCLQSKEIENLLLAQVIIETLKAFDKTDCSSIDFSKISTAKYGNEYLGKYIDNKVSGLSKSYSSKSGTISNKVQFAKVATDNIKEWKDLSEEAKKITEVLYEFIELNN